MALAFGFVLDVQSLVSRRERQSVRVRDEGISLGSREGVLVAQMCLGVILRRGVAGGKGNLTVAEAKGRKACCGMVVQKVKSEAWHNDARPSDSGPLQGPIRPRGYGE